MNRRDLLEAAQLYLVCDAIADDRLRAALRGGVQIVQLRLKDVDDAAIIEAGRRMLAVCREHGALLIVNDHPELAAQID
ncbi:MAG: thiamine phosphate synthase, partial [Solirubrobacteraceae bacterium]